MKHHKHSLRYYFMLFSAVIFILLMLAYLVVDVYMLIKYPSLLERFVRFYPFYLAAWVVLLVLWIVKRLRVSQKIAAEKSGYENYDARKSVINSPEYEKFFIVNRRGVQDEISEQLGYYLKMEDIAQAPLKIAEANGMTVIWFYDKAFFPDFNEIITSLQESFKDESIAYLQHKNTSKFYYIIDNHYQGDYLFLPCVSGTGKTGLWDYSKLNPAVEIPCKDKTLSIPPVKQKILSKIKALDLENLPYQKVQIKSPVE